ncbi:MAG: hypothetical protein ABJ004_11295 [Cyclobacteriaceae bacterium]
MLIRFPSGMTFRGRQKNRDNMDKINSGVGFFNRTLGFQLETVDDTN